MTHCLKTLPEFYEAVISGDKTFEFRENDRNFQIGDKLILQEYNKSTRQYLGRESWFQVTYVLKGFTGIIDGYCVLGIKIVEEF